MQTQQSFKDSGSLGKLYLIPTPIGNLEDMTFRAINMLKEADLIAAEDTRQTKKLCNYFEINTPLTSHHEHNKESSSHKLLNLLREGKTIAVVSDAGMPTISDPGSELVRDAVMEGITVVPLPGANAALTALIASGITPQPFLFYGFLERQKKEKKKELEELKHYRETLIFYESPHRLKETLRVMAEIFGDRQVSLSRELTKKFEEFIRGSLQEVLVWAEENEARGEFCLVVEGTKEVREVVDEAWWSELAIREHVEAYIEKGHSSKEAIKLAASDRGMQKRDVYQAYHID
ncbi:16S rRNA (cytidine(1402)-2'-O)-methyltransferase [Metabacillus sp. GX 13764]|uniref:16S rRNA (cytidine(1402)-2'-O)-methyltransferase n=1 Tax=Metabacillus kandeliae TaxID=2900151 RepID=UPI001E581759|nr:16S rRNA (cytidine(1402)-2'-O)-methyltransferase [Metabacillus kandeliae]MCD7036630.1 16S rRNA (cytidine(1402)-2'-O)-methyltransferase [Metabacillus kandeliae]